MKELENDQEKEEVQLSPAVRIFLVEDNPDHVFTEQDRPDLFLVDLRLPDNGGFSVLQAARANEALSAVPMFVITSSLYDRDIAESYQLGASAVLCKPLS